MWKFSGWYVLHCLIALYTFYKDISTLSVKARKRDEEEEPSQARIPEWSSSSQSSSSSSSPPTLKQSYILAAAASLFFRNSIASVVVGAWPSVWRLTPHFLRFITLHIRYVFTFFRWKASKPKAKLTRRREKSLSSYCFHYIYYKKHNCTFSFDHNDDGLFSLHILLVPFNLTCSYLVLLSSMPNPIFI